MNEFSALADKYALSNKALSAMLSRGERTISVGGVGQEALPGRCGGRRMICICPHCGKSIAAAVRAALCEQTAAAGRTVTPKREKYIKDHIAAVNAAYTPEKRKAAIEKRKRTLAAKAAGK